MCILKTIKTLIRKNMLLRRSASCMAVLAMVVSLASPASPVRAENTGDQSQMEKIESFTGKLVRGASSENGRYVWNAKTDADDHRFTFRVSYEMSGVKDLPPGAIKLWIPKTILKDRSGKYADYMDLSYPSEDEYNAASEEDRKDINYTWKESTDEKHKNCIEITNVKERTAAENGNFEVAYITNEQTFEYKDMGESDPFYCDILVTNSGQTVTGTTDRIPVYINTTAEILSTDKRYPNRLYRAWQPSWGTQPKEAEGKHFLVWEIISEIREDPTQPFTFTLNDMPVSKELHLLGYSMDSQSGPFTGTNYVKNQRSDRDRYDYVLTYYDPAEFKGKDYYELKNSVKATVTPEDKIDAPTSANSSNVWEWDDPKFVHPIGHFYGRKFGDNNWHKNFRYYHDYSSYSLDKLQDGKTKSIDTFRYYIDSYGWPTPWTRDGDADDPASYGKKKVTFLLSDDELYLDDNITTRDTGSDQLEYTIPENAHQLTSDDYQFLYASWNIFSEFRKYDDDEKKFVTDPSGNYSSSDVVHFWAKTGNSKDYTEVATYNLGASSSDIKDSSVVKSLDGKKITFAENANVTGIKFTTSNAYYHTEIEAYPMIRLKNSDYVMKTVKDKNLIRLHNFAKSEAYDSDNEKIYGLKTYAFDRAVRPKKKSEIQKHIVSTASNKIKKEYTLRWKITPKETITTDSGTDFLTQNSGTFYDLLPKGTHLQKNSIDIETEKGILSHSSFTYSIEEDYKGSGRDMIKVTIPVQAKYYNLYLNAEMSWDTIKDYGTNINNPVAYETGNDEIYAGYPDSGGKLSDANRGYMTELDPKCTANDKRFIYNEEPYDIDTVMAAVSGLKKQIKDEHDSSYSYDTYTTPKGNYSYRIRFANTATAKAKNMIFFDSLENYNLNQKHSDWHGVLKRFDVSQLKQKGIAPAIYVSSIENLSIDDHHDITDTSVWQKATNSTDLSKVHAFAIDCRKAEDGKDFVLNEGESLSVVIYMKAPESVNEVKSEYAKAYNNIYIQDTIMNGNTESSFFIHQDYTEIRYRVSADISIHKQNTKDEKEAVEGAKYTLKGTSDYGTEVDTTVTTGTQGNAAFEGIEKGTYTLSETYSPIDWLRDTHKYTIKVDGAGKITCDDTSVTDKIILKDSPRIHGNLSFMKYSTAGNTAVKGAKFRLSGKSKYGTDIMEYATSDENGKVIFTNVEYGNYKLKEVEAPAGYILSKTEYDASISDAGIPGIADAEMLKTGSTVIRNEPYHTVEISKQSSYDDSILKGAEFKLTGTSDYGTVYDKTAVSGENGIAKFTDLEAGNYIIQETKSPKDYFLDSTKHIVKVNKNDTYTIDGLQKNDSGKYRQDNKPEEKGKIIVYKKWKDSKTNAERDKEPVIHITTDVNKVPTYAEWRNNSIIDYQDNSQFYYVSSDYKNKTKKVAYADIAADKVPTNAVRLDKNYSDPDARFKIYGWLTDDGTMYYWTNAQTTRMTDSSNMLFYGLSNATSIDLSHIDTLKITNMRNMFYGCSSLTSLDVSNFNTSKVTDMSLMFYGCKSLTSLDVSNLNMSNVTSMRYMFGMCSKLTSITFSSKLNTSKVTDMSGMFAGCSGLTSLEVSNLDTSNVKDMSYMFQGCSGLTSLDVSKLDTSKVTNMGYMFQDCSGLTSLDVSKLDTSKVTNMGYMFYNCSGLTSLDVSNLDTSMVTDMHNMFCGCSGLTSITFSSKFNTSNVTNMLGMFADCTSIKALDLSSFNTENVTEMNSSEWYIRSIFEGDKSLEKINLSSSFKTSKIKNMSKMFCGCTSLTSLDLSLFDTSNVTDMNRMFFKCSGLTSLNLSSFNTSNVTDMSEMFFECSGLTSLNLSNFNTSNVTNMRSMFYDLELTSLDISNFNTSKVTNMSSMFETCSELTLLDVSNFDTSKVRNMGEMFSCCLSLTSLDVSKFDTSQVTDMSSMFYRCSKLTSLNLSNFNTSKVTDMFRMFWDCYSLTSLDVSNFDTSNVTIMGEMFYRCSYLTSLDLSSFNTSNVTNMKEMFNSENANSNLTNIYVSDKWNTDKVTYSSSMFNGCKNLPNFDSSSTDKTHANYGEGGYLTYKAYTTTAKVNTINTSFASRLVTMLMSKLFTPVYAADSASYVSTDADHCKITKDGDTWTYEFKVVDDSVKYYAYEEDVEGYTSSVAGSYGITAKDKPLTIINTANNIPEEPMPASLSLSKSVDGKQLVEVDKPAEKYSHTANIDDTGKATDTYADSISTNDVVTFPGASKLHVKLYYSTESTKYDWTCVWAGNHADYTAKNNYSSSKLGSASGKIGGGAKTSMSGATVAEGDIDGDTVTFGFRSDSSGAYYGYYAVVTGYNANGNAITQKVKEITDSSPSENIPSAYANKTYIFNVTLKNSDSSKLFGAKIFGDAIFTDGRARVGLKAGEKKTFTGLPDGTTYTVTEDKYNNFYTESGDTSGTLNAGDTKEVKFTNHYQKTAQTDNGFTLKKNVTGFYQNTNNYTFNISFRKLAPDTEYTLSDGTRFTSDASGNGYVQTRLGSKGTVTFSGLPVGTQYRVTEQGGDWSPAYRITNVASDGDIAQNADSAGKNKSLSTEWETVDKGEDITVNYTNTVKKYQSLVLKKIVTGGVAPDKFKFTVSFSNLLESVQSDAGTIVPDDDGTASAEVYLNADDEIRFRNIPITTKYQITEKANAGTASYTVTLDKNGAKAEKTGKNDVSEKDLATSEMTVNEDENATVTFLNNMPDSADVTLKKKVSGMSASKTHYFKFTVSLTGTARKQNYEIDLTDGSSEHDGKKNPLFIKTDEAGHGSAEIWLKHDDTVVIKNLPLKAKYSIAENPDGYKQSITINGQNAAAVSERSVGADTVVFTNTSEPMILPTGIIQHRNAIALACAAIILAVCSAFVLFKRKRKLK